MNNSSLLRALGWTDRWSALFAEVEVAGALPGRVVRRDRGVAVISTEAENVSLPVSGFEQVVTGDWVAFDSERLLAILPRTGALRRRGQDGAEQLFAANVDLVFLVCGVDRPVKSGRIQRGAIQAWDAGASPVVVLNKVDLAPAGELLLAVEQENPGLHVIEVSSQTGQGVEEVRQTIGGRTAVLLGESGAGKSRLMNTLAGVNLAATGAVREIDFKGRHTTTRRELHVIPGTGVVIDTPGIRSFGLAAELEAVEGAFSDIEELAAGCRFHDCAHRTEPGCAVLAAVKSGAMAESRLEAFHKLQKEITSEVLRANPHERHRRERKFGRLVKEAIDMKHGPG